MKRYLLILVLGGACFVPPVQARYCAFMDYIGSLGLMTDLVVIFGCIAAVSLLVALRGIFQ